jgi:hypothetical protein
MAEGPRDPQISAHIQSISAQAEPDRARLVSEMLRLSWPGGCGDRSEPVALEWVRRWGPHRIGPLAPACSCETGRCRVCN